MEHCCSAARLLALVAVLAALLATSTGGSGKHQRKIIIHVPYYIKNHHHTHTVFKYVKGHKGHEGHEGHEGDGGEAGDTESVDGGEGASLEQGQDHGDQEHFQHHHHHHDDQPEFSAQHRDPFPHHDEEATQDAPLALGLRGEPAPSQGHQSHQDGDDGGGDGGRDHHNHGSYHHHHHHHQERQRGREEGAHSHHQDGPQHHQHQGDHHYDHHDHAHDDDYHHHHRHHGGGDDDGREHAHFHTKFVVSGEDGQLRETDSSESSEQSSLEPHKGRAPFILGREQEYHNRYEHTDHGSFSGHATSLEGQGEDFNHEEKLDSTAPSNEGYNTLQTEQRTDESQHFPNPSSPVDKTAPFHRHPHHNLADRFAPKDNRDQTRTGSKRVEERPRRHRYEVEEHNKDSSPKRTSHSHHDHKLDHHRSERQRFNFNWR